MIFSFMIDLIVSFLPVITRSFVVSSKVLAIFVGANHAISPR